MANEMQAGGGIVISDIAPDGDSVIMVDKQFIRGSSTM